MPASFRLGMILKGYPRISETFISNEILSLERHSFAIRIFSMRQPREPFTHASVRAIRAPVDYLPETLLGSLPRLLPPNVRLAKERPGRYSQAVRLARQRLARSRRLATIKHLLQAGYLTRLLLPATGITHLHAHFAHSPASVAMFASILSGLPFSFTAHAKDIYTSRPAQLGEKIARARFVVTCTEKNRDYLAGLASQLATPIHAIHHGIDVTLFSRNGNLRREAGPPYEILTVARLTPKKGLPTIYRALGWLRKQGVHFHHTLIGDGEERLRVLQLVKDLGLEQESSWIGAQPHEIVLDHYRRADLFVLGSEIAANGDRDGLPNVILESMAMEVPVVATSTSAIPEAVTDGATGLLVEPGQPEAMGRAMLRLLTDCELRRRVIAAAAHQVRQSFDNQILARQLVRVLSSG